MDRRPRTVVLSGRHRPHEIGLLVVSAITSLGILIAPAPAITIVFPGWKATAWAVVLMASSVIGLAGCFWRGSAARGLMVEGAGMVLSVAAILWYMVGAWIIQADQLAAAEATVGVWGAMNLWRAAQIHMDLRELR